MPFSFEKLDIPEVVRIKPRSFGDKRGFFAETYKRSEFCANGIPNMFVQDNYSYSERGVLRGLHYQKHPKPQGKLVMTLEGEIFDVAVDIRRGSPIYGKWAGIVLSAGDYCSVYIPVGFAHGFYVLSDKARVVYKVTQEYSPECERGIIWNDPEIGIRWPGAAPHVSERDSRLPTLREADINFAYGGELT